jgi:hypothetical protein
MSSLGGTKCKVAQLTSRASQGQDTPIPSSNMHQGLS